MAIPKSLKARIDALFNAIGGEQKPSYNKIRSELSTFASLAESLENDQATAKKEAKIAALKAENKNLKVELQTANAEIKRFQAERKKQEEKEREIPPIQFKILHRLPSENEGDGATLKVISRRANIWSLEAKIHLDRLEKAGFAKRTYYDITGGGRITAWHRTMPGNELILAKRLAGEEDQEAARKYPDLPPIQHEALLMMVGEDEGINEREIAKRLGKSLPLTQHRLSLLRDAEMATDGEEGDYGTGRTWVLLRRGEEYLAERDLL